MQQLRLRFDAFGKLTNNTPTILCESCLMATNKPVKLCNFCLHFICHQCSPNHDLHVGEVPQIQSHSQWNQISADSQEFSKNQKTFNQQFDSLGTSKLQFKGICQRCQSKVGNKTCFGCSNKIYCLSCFNQLHSTEKFSSHKTAQIKKSETKVGEQTLNWNKRDQMLKKSDKQRNLNHSFKLQTKFSGQIQQLSSINLKVKLEQINKNVVNLSLLKASWNENVQKMQRAYDELFTNIKKELEQKIEDIKLKILQIQLKIKSKKDQLMQQSKEYLDSINQIVIRYKNVEVALQTKKSTIDLEQIAQKLIRNLAKKSDILSQRKQEMLNSEIQPKISQQFYTDMQVLKEKLNKIQYKKIVVKQEPKNTLLILSSPKTEKKLPLEFKSDGKGMKKSLNLATCKSQNKVNPLTQSQNNSESNSKSRNTNKNENKLISSPIILKSYATTPSQQMAMTNRAGFGSKTPKQAKKMGLGLNMKQFRSKGALQKSARITNKVSYMDSKSGVNKAILNIETTKKMINQLRTQMSEFSICRLNNGESECQTNTDKQNQESQYLQNTSRISIESLIMDEEKEI